MVVVRTVLVWLAIALGVCWVLLKLFGKSNRRKEGEDEESHSIFRK